MTYVPTEREVADAQEFNNGGPALKAAIGGAYPDNQERFLDRARDFLRQRGHGPDVDWLVDNLIEDQYVAEARRATFG